MFVVYRPMSGKALSKVSSRSAEPRSTPDQERFKFLIAQIEKTRKARLEWEARVLEFRKEQSARVQPLRTTLTTVSRDTVFLLDRMLDQPGWSRAERGALKDILCGTADVLLEANQHDAELKAVFDKHSAQSFDAAKQEELRHLKEEAEEATGFDLGDDDSIRSEEDLIQRMYEQMSAQEKAARETRAERDRKSAAQKRVEANARAAKEFLREIYRKLASAVHPDREPDSTRRAAKNELMQKINRAYATSDLLTLLETQMQLDQIDPDHIGKLSGQRLKQYNKLLAEQLETARAALRDLESGFRLDHGIEPGSSLSPQKLTIIMQRQTRAIRAEITRQKQFLLVLASKASTKRWLKEQRRFAKGWLDDDED
jgi:hypothetical protein